MPTTFNKVRLARVAYIIFILLATHSLAWCDYLIGPEDVIEVFVWKEPDVSRVVLVRPDGKISLPLIGDIKAEGLSPKALAEELKRAFSEYIEAPEVSVIVKEVNSAKIYVMGKVNSPGVFPLRTEITVLQAITLAGGFAEWAKKSKIIILRKIGEKDKRIVVNIDRVIDGKKGAEDVRLQPGDRIIVP